MKNNVLILGLIIFVVSILFGCGQRTNYTTEEFEEALNNGDDVTGKTVVVKVKTLVTDSPLGYNIQAGQHLNFVAPVHPKVKEGDKITLKVEKYVKVFGSFIITYEK